MRFIEHPALSRLSALIKDLDVGDRLLCGRLELFGTEMVHSSTATKRQKEICKTEPGNNFIELPLVAGDESASGSITKDLSCEDRARVESVGCGYMPEKRLKIRETLKEQFPVERLGLLPGNAQVTEIGDQLYDTSQWHKCRSTLEGSEALAASASHGKPLKQHKRSSFISPLQKFNASLRTEDTADTLTLSKEWSVLSPSRSGRGMGLLNANITAQSASSPSLSDHSLSVVPQTVVGNHINRITNKTSVFSKQRAAELPALHDAVCSTEDQRQRVGEGDVPIKSEHQPKCDIKRKDVTKGQLWSTLGSNSTQEGKEMLVHLVTTLNACFPDYDFSSVTPGAFVRINDFVQVYTAINYHLSFLAERVVPGFLRYLWGTIKDLVDLRSVQIYSYANAIGQIESDPYLDDDTCLFSFDYFFVDRKQHRILFFSCMTKRKTEDVRSLDDSDSDAQTLYGDDEDDGAISGPSTPFSLWEDEVEDRRGDATDVEDEDSERGSRFKAGQRLAAVQDGSNSTQKADLGPEMRILNDLLESNSPSILTVLPSSQEIDVDATSDTPRTVEPPIIDLTTNVSTPRV